MGSRTEADAVITTAKGRQMTKLHRAYESIDAPVGTFAGTRTAGALTVGSYGNVAHTGLEAAGTFAGDPNTQRRGSFGDAGRRRRHDLPGA
jgi:hypothetical protein